MQKAGDARTEGCACHSITAGHTQDNTSSSSGLVTPSSVSASSSFDGLHTSQTSISQPAKSRPDTARKHEEEKSTHLDSLDNRKDERNRKAKYLSSRSTSSNCSSDNYLKVPERRRRRSLPAREQWLNQAPPAKTGVGQQGRVHRTSIQADSQSHGLAELLGRSVHRDRDLANGRTLSPKHEIAYRLQLERQRQFSRRFQTEADHENSAPLGTGARKLSPDSMTSVYNKGFGNSLMVPHETRRRSSVSSADEEMEGVLDAYMQREKRKRSLSVSSRGEITKIDTSKTQGNIVCVSILITLLLSVVIFLSWYLGGNSRRPKSLDT